MFLNKLHPYTHSTLNPLPIKLSRKQEVAEGLPKTSCCEFPTSKTKKYQASRSNIRQNRATRPGGHGLGLFSLPNDHRHQSSRLPDTSKGNAPVIKQFNWVEVFKFNKVMAWR